MKAMILAAGLGTRMRPLTNHLPKPMLKVAGKPLLEWHIERLKQAGIHDIVINIAWKGHKIIDYFGNGQDFNINIRYSDERNETTLETAGGIIKALPLLGDEPFFVISGDIWCDYHYPSLSLGNDLAHIVLVNNPPHHPEGDFKLTQGRVNHGKGNQLTFSGIGYYHPALFNKLAYGNKKIASILHLAIANNQIQGDHHCGQWHDIGTPKRLEALEKQLHVT